MKSQKAKEFIEEEKFTSGISGKDYLEVFQAKEAVELAEEEMTEQHEKDVAELKERMKEKAIDSYISSCILNNKGYCIADESDCMRCSWVENFIKHLNND